MHPKGCSAPRCYRIPQDPKVGHPHRPIVSSRGLVTYGVTKVHTKILNHLLVSPPNHIHSTQDFVEQANKVNAWGMPQSI